MKAFAQRITSDRLPLTFIGMLAISAFIGIAAGSRVTFQFKTFFYTVVLANAILMVYLLILKDMVYGVLIYLFSLVFLNYYWRIVIPGHWPDIDLPRLTFVFIWIVFLLEVGFGVRRLIPSTRIELAMFGVVCAIIASMVTNGQVHIRNLLNGFAIPYAIFIVAKNVFITQRDVDKFIYLFALPLSFYFPINHMFEHYGVNQFVFPRYILDPHVAGREVIWEARAMGAFLQPSATGMAMVSMFIMSLYGLTKMRGLLPRVVALFITAITPITVFFTYTRSVYVGFASAMMVLLIFSRRSKVYAGIIIVGIILAVLGNWSNVVTEDRQAGGVATKSTVVGRLVLAEASLRMFADHPFVGVGFRNFQEHSLPYVRQVRTTLLGYRESWVGKDVGQHNHFLNILTETGLMGFVPLLAVFYLVFRTLRKAHNCTCKAYDHDFVVAVWAVFAQWISNAMSMEPRFYEFMNVLPFMLAGIIVGGYQRTMLHRWNNNIGERSPAGEGTIR